MFNFGKRKKTDPYGITPDRRQSREPMVMDIGDPVTIRLARKLSKDVSGSVPAETPKHRVSQASLFFQR